MLRTFAQRVGQQGLRAAANPTSQRGFADMVQNKLTVFSCTLWDHDDNYEVTRERWLNMEKAISDLGYKKTETLEDFNVSYEDYKREGGEEITVFSNFMYVGITMKANEESVKEVVDALGLEGKGASQAPSHSR